VDFGLGNAVALSDDGSTALIGASGAYVGTGEAYVFVRPGSFWSTTEMPTATLSVNGLRIGSLVGSAVALSRDGSHALLGGPDANSLGSAYLFVRPSSGWLDSTVPVATYTDSTLGQNGRLGGAVALADDGGTMLIGAPGAQDNLGLAGVYAQPSTGWHDMSNPDATLTATGPEKSNAFGASVAVSVDGTVVLVGADTINNLAGAAYVFVRTGSNWSSTSSPTAILSAQNITRASYFVEAVALSSDGATALIGAPDANNGAGQAYLFVRPAAGWATTNAPTGSLYDGDPNSHFGSAVALSAHGSTALIGTRYYPAQPGSAYVCTWPRGGWSAFTDVSAVLTVSGSGQYSEFGSDVALSDDGATALIGAEGAGAAYIYSRPLTGWTSMSSPNATLTFPVERGFGGKVALSGDGSTALVSALGVVIGEGSADIYMRGGAAWTDQSTPVAILDGGAADQGGLVGADVALSEDGSVALVSAEDANNGAGIAFVFVRPSSGWTGGSTMTTTAPAAILDNGGLGTDSHFGWCVALSGDGNTALVGAFGANSNAGAVQVFAPALPLSGRQSVSFGVGWSLFTLPLIPAAGTVHASDVLSAILASTHGNVAALYALSNNRWSLSLTDLHRVLIGQDFTLAPGAGYLLYSDRAGGYVEASAALLGNQQWALGAGWNLEGLAATADAAPPASSVLDAILAGTHGGVAAIYGLSNSQWSPSLVDQHGTVIGQDFTLQPGAAYLVYSDRPGSITPDAVRQRGGSMTQQHSPLSGTALRALLRLRPPAIP
jgi:hypothetical protein